MNSRQEQMFKIFCCCNGIHTILTILNTILNTTSTGNIVINYFIL
uniref:Uncharacterized protein n=1 Tax=Anguilla anguilla TaxID=7936 RepID=A0A0E9P645_ANGAN